MEKKELDMLKGILEKKRNCIPLTSEEQTWADRVYNQLLDKKFGNKTFEVKTGDEIRKVIGDTISKDRKIQPGDAIADERSEFGKEQDIEDDDNTGTVKEVEEGDNINVDEKDEDEAKNVNASDIVNADNDDEQRKPTFKFGDVVVKDIRGNLYAGVILKYYESVDAVMVKWANGTFSNEYSSNLKLVKDAVEEENKKPVEDKVAESEETPQDEAAETPEEQAVEEAEGTEQHDQPTDEEVKENEWTAKCVSAVGKNADVENPAAMCAYVSKSMKKSGDTIIKMTVAEIRETGNNKLADSMDKDGHSHLTFDTTEFSKGGPGSGRHSEGVNNWDWDLKPQYSTSNINGEEKHTVTHQGGAVLHFKTKEEALNHIKNNSNLGSPRSMGNY